MSADYKLQDQSKQVELGWLRDLCASYDGRMTPMCLSSDKTMAKGPLEIPVIQWAVGLAGFYPGI